MLICNLSLSHSHYCCCCHLNKNSHLSTFLGILQGYLSPEKSLLGRYYYSLFTYTRLPWWLSGKEFAGQCRRHGFDPWVGKIPWRRRWQPTPVFLPVKSHGQGSLAGYSPWGSKSTGSDSNETIQIRGPRFKEIDLAKAHKR